MIFNDETRSIMLLDSDYYVSCKIANNIVNYMSIETTVTKYNDVDIFFNRLSDRCAIQEYPSLILCNFLIGSINGIEILERLRNYPPIPVVMYGGCSSVRNVITRLYRSGLNGYFILPDSDDKLTNILQCICNLYLNIPQPNWYRRNDRSAQP